MLLIAGLFASGNMDSNLTHTINEIISINKQLHIIKDKNSTLSGINYGTILAKKKKLISQIPSFLVDGGGFLKNFNYKDKLSYLELRISINTKAKYENAVARDKIALIKLDADNTFYATLYKLKDFSQKSPMPQEIRASLEEALLKLQTMQASTLPNGQKKLNGGDYSWEKLENDRDDLVVSINTYVQILDYFHKNIGLISSNYLLSKLDIDYFISFVNSHVPFKSKYMNVGKIVVCGFVLVFFWILIRLLGKRKFLIFVFPFKKSPYDEQTKQAIIRSTNRPFVAILIAIALKICFSIFYHPYAITYFANSIFSIIFISLISWLIIGVLNGYGIAFINTMIKDDSSFRKDVVNLILKILYFLVLVIAFLLILGSLGVNVSAIIASLGIGGLAVAWASKDILANFFASILLLIDNSFSQGDWIVCNGVNGIVVEIGLRRTTIRTFDNALLFVPNSILASDPIRNWTRRKIGRRIKMSIGVTYDSPKDKLEKCVKEIRQMLLSHPKIAKPDDKSLDARDYKESFKQHVVSMADLRGYKRNLFVYLNEFGASSIDILVYCFSNSTNWEDWLKVKEDVMLKIMDIVEQNGLSFAFPSQSLYIESMPVSENLDLKTKGGEIENFKQNI